MLKTPSPESESGNGEEDSAMKPGFRLQIDGVVRPWKYSVSHSWLHMVARGGGKIGIVVNFYDVRAVKLKSLYKSPGLALIDPASAVLEIDMAKISGRGGICIAIFDGESIDYVICGSCTVKEVEFLNPRLPGADFVDIRVIRKFSAGSAKGN
ncbi:hypothetical protein [Nocardiopsis sp. CC223A]|uniref:hypothetical protein n=1 Tax=Nocardiopsis sp. CC223A TaxID=3044051 RepID=UPI002795DBCC|nr:hypothetical protein [Nocardiopsis sp. CC223A]